MVLGSNTLVVQPFGPEKLTFLVAFRSLQHRDGKSDRVASTKTSFQQKDTGLRMYLR